VVEHRKEPRSHLIYYLRVFDRQDNSLFGHVVDISSSGMLISCDQTLQKNHQYKLAVEDTTVMERLDVLNFDAVCKWCNEDETSLLVDGGFQLLSPSSPVSAMIADFH